LGDETFIDRLRAEIDYETATLIGVATRDIAIEDASADYKRRRRIIRQGLRALGLDDPNPWPELWSWYGFYKEREELGTYQARREHVIRRYQPLLTALERLEERQLGTGIDAPDTSWADVDGEIRQLRQRYATAQTPEDFRAVGLLCRDILISLGHAVFDPDRHLSIDQPMPKRDDAKNRIDYVVQAEFPGSDNHRLRALVKAQWDFVQPVVHTRTDTEKKARLAADGTIYLANTLRALIPEPTGTIPPPEEEPPPSDWDTPADSHQDWELDEDDLAYVSRHWAAEEDQIDI
jgi:hypothetical protein